MNIFLLVVNTALVNKLKKKTDERVTSWYGEYNLMVAL